MPNILDNPDLPTPLREPGIWALPPDAQQFLSRWESIPEFVRNVAERDVHLRSILKAWATSGNVPANPLQNPLGDMNAPEWEYKAASLQDALAYAVFSMVVNKAAILSAVAAQRQ